MSKADQFDSTVALTFYNLLCKTVGTADLAQLVHAARSVQHPTLQDDQAERALNELERRRWVKREGNGFAVRDPRRRLVVSRDTSGDEAAKGYLQGGWSRWHVQDKGGIRVPIERAAEGDL